jgi:hypothetical protein
MHELPLSAQFLAPQIELVIREDQLHTRLRLT